MKILLITQGFYPRISPRSFRATELAKEFIAQGHDVTVSTIANPAHGEFAEKYNVRFKYLQTPRWKDVDIKRGGKFLSLMKRGLRRCLQLAIEFPNVELVHIVKKFINKEKEEYDALISIAVPYPIHWGVAASKWKKIAKTWIADCGDPYYGDTSDTFKKLFYFKYIEKWAFRKMDKVTIPIEKGKKGYFREFYPKIHVIPQGFNFGIPKAKYIPNDIPYFIYAGGLAHVYRNPRPFLQYLTTIEKPFKFVVYTRNKNLIRPFVKALKGKLELKDYVPREELMMELSKADFLVNIANATDVQSPSKLIDYKIAGRPILNIEQGEVNKKVINDFLNGDYCQQYDIPNIEQYDIKNVVKEFVKLIKECN